MGPTSIREMKGRKGKRRGRKDGKGMEKMVGDGLGEGDGLGRERVRVEKRKRTWPLRGGEGAKGRGRNGKGAGMRKRGKGGGKLEQGRRMAKAGPGDYQTSNASSHRRPCEIILLPAFER